MKNFIPSFLLLGFISVASGAPVVIMPDSGANNRLVAFSPVDGSVVNNNVFGLAGGTPISAIQVGNEVWVSEQLGDRISRWDWAGNPLGAAGVGILDNNRGITLIQGVVYTANDGTLFGAGDTLVRFDVNGNHLGNWSTAGLNPSPWYVLFHNNQLITTSSSANDDVHRFDLTGGSLGTFYNGTNAFAQQAALAADGSILISWFTTNRVSKHDAVTGAELSSFTAAGARGVYQLSNGNILWSNGSGAHVYDVITQTSTLVYTGAGRLFSLADLPAGDQTLSGTLSLSDTVAAFAAARNIGWEVKQGATTVASGTLSPAGSTSSLSLAVPSSVTGAVQLILDGSSFLKRTTTLTLTGSNLAIGTITLQNGDVDNSGEVDAADIDAVIADFGSTSVAATDVDVSGEVDAADIDIVIANFGGVDN